MARKSSLVVKPKPLQVMKVELVDCKKIELKLRSSFKLPKKGLCQKISYGDGNDVLKVKYVFAGDSAADALRRSYQRYVSTNNKIKYKKRKREQKKEN